MSKTVPLSMNGQDCKIVLMPLKDKLIPGTLSILVRYGNINFLANEQRRIWSGMIVTIVTQSVSSGQSESGMPGPPCPPPYFYRSVNPFSTRGTDCADYITTNPTGFSSHPTALNSLTHRAEKDI